MAAASMDCTRVAGAISGCLGMWGRPIGRRWKPGGGTDVGSQRPPGGGRLGAKSSTETMDGGSGRPNLGVGRSCEWPRCRRWLVIPG